MQELNIITRKMLNLKEYQSKRDFNRTSEPRVKKTIGELKKGKKLLYCIQHHFSKKPHWDLRLEIDGVLKSWAIPKEPPKDKTKRLAIQVEDHPVEYAKFKGIIPEGNYGAGKVEIWDKGNYELKERTENKIEFILHGKKLKGNFVLVKTHYGNKPEKSWLFFKV